MEDRGPEIPLRPTNPNAKKAPSTQVVRLRLADFDGFPGTLIWDSNHEAKVAEAGSVLGAGGGAGITRLLHWQVINIVNKIKGRTWLLVAGRGRLETCNVMMDEKINLIMEVAETGELWVRGTA